MTAERDNTVWSGSFAEGLEEAGLREVCVAPGSRSTPLVLALAARERIRTFVHLDERCAAFFALGVGKASGRPAAVLTTSGTATANLYPAVVEASRSGTPLLVLTADRPRRLRGTDANQTIDQASLYGRHVRFFHDVAAPGSEDADLRYARSLAARALCSAREIPAGAVHVNFPFEKPLEPARASPADAADDGNRSGPPASAPAADPSAPRIEPGRRTLPADRARRLVARIRGTARGLVVCGPAARPEAAGPAALRLAVAAGYPILADPLSGARFSPGTAGDVDAPGSYDLFLRDPELRGSLAPEIVLRIGPAPTSAVLSEFLEERAAAHQVVIDAGPVWADHRAVASEYLRVDPADACRDLAKRLEAAARETGPRASERLRWRERWRRAERAAREALEAELRGEFFEGAAVSEVARTLPDGATLFVGSSMPVRDLDAFAAPREARLRVLGNRGASGIDGSMSTAAGAAAVSDGPAAAVVGDLAFYHDMNGLLAVSRLRLDLVIVVINNDGGGIFHMLPIREHEPAFTRYFATPHGLDLERAAALYRIPFRRAEDRRALAEELREGLEAGGPRILEVPSDREQNRRRHEEVAEVVRRAGGVAPGRDRELRKIEQK